MVTAPGNITVNQTGTLAVYGTVAAMASNTATQTIAVTAEANAPTDLAKTSPTLRVEATPTPAKKRITISFDKLPFPFRWSAKITGIGVATVIESAGAGPQTFLMVDNQYVNIDTYTKNSCGVLPANSYAYRLKNGAMLPVELQ